MFFVWEPPLLIVQFKTQSQRGYLEWSPSYESLSGPWDRLPSLNNMSDMISSFIFHPPIPSYPFFLARDNCHAVFYFLMPHLQRHQSSYKRPGHQKKGHGEAVGWRRTKKPGSWMGSPFRLIRLDVIIIKLHLENCIFFESSQHMLSFFFKTVA